MQRITTAPVGQRQHQQQQIGRYLVSMGVRTSCFVIAIFLATSGVRWLMWLTWVFVALAVVLPYIAVLVANAGRETPRPTTTQVTPAARPALASAPSRPARDEPLVGYVTEPPAEDAARTGRSSAAPTGAPPTAGPRTWDTERLRPPAEPGGASGGGSAHGDQRSAA